ncbi:hypothetical protein E3A20_29500, partial [Planctomyces bekefii]
MQGIFRGRFRFNYLVAKTLSCYAGTFFLCYHLPQFINYVIDPPPIPEVGAVAFLPPFGLLVLGGLWGKRVFLFHLALL